MVDTASGLKEQVKDLPTNARYAVYQGKSKVKENVRDLTSSISQTKADRASGRKEQQEQRRKTIAKRRSEMEQVKQKNSLLLLFMKDRLQDKNNIMMNRPQNSLIFRLHIRNLNKPNKSVQQLSPIFKSKVERQGNTVQEKPFKSQQLQPLQQIELHNVQSQKNVRLLFKEYHYKIQEVDHQSKPPPLRKSVRNHEVENFSDWWFWIILDGLLTASVCCHFISDEQDSGISNIHYGGVNVSAEVLAHKPMVEKYAKEYGVEEYVNILLAIIQVESGGTAEDVMQSSESLGLPPNSLSTEESIKQGVKYFSELLASSERLSVDLESVIQSYNYGGGFLGYVANRGNKYTFELAQSFSKEYSGGEKVSYPNPIAIPINGGWRYNYGNMFYVQLVTQYLVTTEFDDDTVQAIMDEALKYEGWRYVYGGASPTTSFDCSGLTQWTYGKAGINLPRTAQQQYDVTQHIPLSEAQAGDLVFFHSTYNAGSYITHVGIYLGNNRMFHAGDPIGYADLTSPYWQQHLVGAGRIKQ